MKSSDIDINRWLTWLVGKNLANRRAARFRLCELTARNRVEIQPLIDGLRSNNSDVSFWCVMALSGLRQKAKPALPDLSWTATTHQEFGVREAAVMALAKIAPEDKMAKAVVMQACYDSSPYVRRQALEAIIDFDCVNRQDLAKINAMQKDTDEMIADWAEIALRNIRLKRNRRKK